MHLQLFDQTVLLPVTILTTTLMVSFLALLKKNRLFWKKLGICAGISLVIVGIALLRVHATGNLSNIPGMSVYLLAAWLLFFGLVVCSIRAGWLAISTGCTGILFLLLLQLMVINNFYHYYPDMASIFTKQADNNNQTLITKAGNSVHKTGSLEEQLTGGSEQKGLTYVTTIPGTTSHFKARNSIVYLPPAYQNNAAVRFPVMILLNGTPGAPEDWLHGVKLEAIVDGFSNRHNGIAPIIVVADHNGTQFNDTECVDSSRGNAEQYLTVDVPAYIKSHFRVSEDANNWGIGGLSEGGMCGAVLTLRHQDIFLHFLDMSGDVQASIGKPTASLSILFNGSRSEQNSHDISWLLGNRPLSNKLTGQFVVARDDRYNLAAIQQAYTAAHQSNVTSFLEIIPKGGHTFTTWSQGFKDSIAKLSYFLGATKCESTCN